MQHKTADTYTVAIYMAGDMAHAKQVIRQYVLHVGLCVTIEPSCFIYTGGEEAGFRVGLINYPRFPSSKDAIFETALELANKLRDSLAQHSFSIVTPDITIWDSLREPAPLSINEVSS